MTSPLPTLTGTPKQVAYATAIRNAWVDGQRALAQLEARRGGGLVIEGELIDPKPEDLEMFTKISLKRLAQLEVMITTRTTAKSWIESPEGDWFRRL